eukprot:UN1903
MHRHNLRRKQRKARGLPARPLFTKINGAAVRAGHSLLLLLVLLGLVLFVLRRLVRLGARLPPPVPGLLLARLVQLGLLRLRQFE